VRRTTILNAVHSSRKTSRNSSRHCLVSVIRDRMAMIHVWTS